MLTKFRVLFKSSLFLRNVVTLTSGTILAQGLTLLFSPVLTRLYQPEDYGVLTVYISLLALSSIVVTLRYELAIPLPKEDKVAANLLVFSLAVIVTVTSLITILIWSVGTDILHFFQMDKIEPYMYYLPLSLLGIGFYQVLTHWAIRTKQFGSISKTKIMQSIAQIILQLLGGLLGKGPLGLLLGDVAGRIGGSGSLARVIWKDYKGLIRNVSLPEIRSVAYRYRKFFYVSTVSSLINNLGLQLSPLMFTMLYGTQVTGWIAFGERIIGMPMLLIGQSVAQVFLGEAASLVQQKPRHLEKMYFKIAGRLLLLGALFISAIFFWGSDIFSLVFGSEWGKSGEFIRLLAVMYLIQFVVVPLSQTLIILEKQGWQLAWDIMRLLVVGGGLYFSGISNLPARDAVIVYGITMSFSYLLLFILTVLAIKRKTMQGENQIDSIGS